MNSGRYSTQGRTIMVQFKCGRCGKVHIEPYERQAETAEGNLHCYKPPEGWKDSEHFTPMLCPECHGDLKEFMKAGEG